MNSEQLRRTIGDGFIKVTAGSKAQLDGATRSALIRKGNELFNKGDIETARRIFLTVHYADGIIRVGDHYYKRDMPLEALKMYWTAPDRHRVEMMAEKMAAVVRSWLAEE